MRVLMTGDTAGGVFTFVAELARALEGKGHQVTLATFGPTPSESPEGVRWFHHRSKLEWQPEPWDDLEEAARWVRALVDSEKPDLLHFNTLCHGDRNWCVPVVTTIHSCVPSWWQSVRKAPLPTEWNRYRHEVQRSLEASSRLIFPTESLRQMFYANWDVAGVESAVIPNGMDGSQFHRAPKESLILAAGRLWDEAKNIPALDAVAQAVEWPIYLAGDGAARTACNTLGRLSAADLRGWYSRASIFVSPALYEPFGLAVLEAALSGCALVLNDIPSFRENWSGAAIFCKPDEISGTLAHLMQNSAFRTDLQQQAQLRAGRFSHTAMAGNYQTTYEQVRAHACVS